VSGLELGRLGLGFLAGILSIFSPCVLPLLPLVFGAAAATHRWGIAALAAGLVTGFVAIGLFIGAIGFSIGLDEAVFRAASAVVLAVFGLVLLSGALQARFAMATAGIGDASNRLMARVAPSGAASGLGGQLLLGLALGGVWSPCVGPTLGAASVLASQGKELASVAGVMIAFGLGTALPLLAIGSLSRQALLRWRGRMLQAGRTGQIALGGVALAVALMILTGADRVLETQAVAASPAWLINLTTRF
jgi:cytochrome c-type biogenesis protein